MKNTHPDPDRTAAQLTARFGGRFLCRSPPATAARRRLFGLALDTRAYPTQRVINFFRPATRP